VVVAILAAALLVPHVSQSAILLPRPPPTTSGTSGPPPDPGAPPSSSLPWNLSFDDEFDGTSLDQSKWSTCYDWSCTNAGTPELEWYQSENVSVGNGVAQLTARAQPAGGKPFTSGMIQSNGHFDFLYGYAEARVLLPAGVGLWPAFWMIPADHSWPPEIDVMEFNGGEPDTIMENVFPQQGPPIPPFNLYGQDFSAGYHTFGVDWEPGSVSWYVDGVLERHVAVSITKPLYLVANLALTAVPAPSASEMPATMSIDFIRVFQHPSDVSPQAGTG
jgi:beta-glucanase (GH16 family)